MPGYGIPIGCHGNALTSKGSETLGSKDHIAFLDSTTLLCHAPLTHKETRVFLFDQDTLLLGRSVFEKIKGQDGSKAGSEHRSRGCSDFADTGLA